jgi:LPS O-antigen subunit length determinant protein (WzzB/FepE family)
MTSEYSPLDDVIDLRKYISLLLAKKWWIIAATLVFALFGFGLTRVLPEKYQSTSIAAVTQTRNQLNFDPRIETIYDFSLNYQSYATLAESDFDHPGAF